MLCAVCRVPCALFIATSALPPRLSFQTLQPTHHNSLVLFLLSTFTHCFAFYSFIVLDLATLHSARNHVCHPCRIAHRSCSCTATHRVQRGDAQTCSSLMTVLSPSSLLDTSFVQKNTAPLFLYSIIEFLQHDARVQGTSRPRHRYSTSA